MEMIKGKAKTQNIRMPLFGLLISFCVFIEYEKFNNSTTQSIFPYNIWESDMKQRITKPPPIHTSPGYEMEFNIFIFHCVYVSGNKPLTL